MEVVFSVGVVVEDVFEMVVGICGLCFCVFYL